MSVYMMAARRPPSSEPAHANAGYDQAYKTLAAVARWWSQEAPEVLARVLVAIPALSAERVDDDDARFTFGDILFEASRASRSPPIRTGTPGFEPN